MRLNREGSGNQTCMTLASFPGRFVGGGKTAWYRLFVIFRYTLRTRSFTAGLQASAVCNKLANCMSCACCVEQRLAFALQKVGKGRLTLKKEQLSAIRSAYDQVDAFAWLLTGFGKSIEYKCLPFYSITS